MQTYTNLIFYWNVFFILFRLNSKKIGKYMFNSMPCDDCLYRYGIPANIVVDCYLEAIKRISKERAKFSFVRGECYFLGEKLISASSLSMIRSQLYHSCLLVLPYFFSIFFSFTFSVISHGFQWTTDSGGSVPTIRVCQNEQLTLPWNVTVFEGDVSV